ncbi:hypothetical protein M9H77_17476 [Catharanthus roseus]|uniref:Uncharacterized protein n=1 Tax=Catharanthus roseus TaxID=4058 RepID=A0ACC0B4P7_CATRO|nr:hypothetical protein M9H77_17476 [Catharanthus roseus]
MSIFGEEKQRENQEGHKVALFIFDFSNKKGFQREDFQPRGMREKYGVGWKSLWDNFDENQIPSLSPTTDSKSILSLSLQGGYFYSKWPATLECNTLWFQLIF